MKKMLEFYTGAQIK